VHLLPMYDEYFVAYRDLNAVPRANGLQATLVAGGQAVGAWEIAREGDQTRVDVEATRPLNDLETSALGETAARYGRFLGTTVSVSGRSLAQSV
jgi:hypothetical protein